MLQIVSRYNQFLRCFNLEIGVICTYGHLVFIPHNPIFVIEHQPPARHIAEAVFATCAAITPDMKKDDEMKYILETLEPDSRDLWLTIGRSLLPTQPKKKKRPTLRLVRALPDPLLDLTNNRVDNLSLVTVGEPVHR